MGLTEEDFYTDPKSGMLVLTAEFLKKRGKCCGKRCRHCPYIPRHTYGTKNINPREGK